LGSASLGHTTRDALWDFGPVSNLSARSALLNLIFSRVLLSPLIYYSCHVCSLHFCQHAHSILYHAYAILNLFHRKEALDRQSNREERAARKERRLASFTSPAQPSSSFLPLPYLPYLKSSPTPFPFFIHALCPSIQIPSRI
jgi:hypothetical protein